MKLTSIQTSNFLGARAVDVKLAKPVTLFAGKNYAGKSSVQEAVRMALTGESVRVALKKDFGALITEGQDAGYVTVEWAGGEASIVLPKGDRHLAGDQISGALPWVLDAQRFASMADNDRHAFLFGLMGLKTDGAIVKDRLIARGCDAKKIEQIAPFLRAGFEAAQKEAQGKARDGKASWKTATGGETYGAVKAATWKAAKPEASARNGLTGLKAMHGALAAVEAELEAETIKLGAAADREKKAREQAGRLAELRETAGKFARIQDKLNKDEAELKTWAAKVEDTRAKAAGVSKKPPTFSCPCCGVVLTHRLADGAAIKFVEPEQQADPEAIAALPEHERALKLFENSVANGKRDLAAAETAARTLAEIEAEGAEAVSGDAEALRVRVDGLKQRRTIHQTEIRALEDARSQATDADKRTEAAAGHHATVQAWDMIADALAPDGIPSEMLAEALGPINDRLSVQAGEAQWPAVAVGKDMDVTYGGRAYALLSESEKWRADAMIAEAVSCLSGVRLLVLDRFDCLDLQGREDALYWLDELAAADQIDSALIFGTLKSLPAQLPESIQGVWIENGTAGQIKEAA